MSVTDHDQLNESMLLSGYDPDGEFLRQFYQQTRGVRRVGSVALNLAFVAAGNADGAWEFNTSPWDVAAGLRILKEAGGVATNGENTPYAFELDTAGTRNPLLVSNGSLHEQLVRRLQE
ncbi:MAG: archaeal fructose-1,6-bisphosphatase related enzymes of inositol monophosphatase family [halophilic archaeon J07HX5]|nr:MAG: archaeal fructose-1,6-bisphosphatase related enzymes of inositol monophosphatase family [halophilic archaeon J07HX5]